MKFDYFFFSLILHTLHFLVFLMFTLRAVCACVCVCVRACVFLCMYGYKLTYILK